MEKGLDILEALSAASTPLSLTDLAKTLGRSPSELFRMVGYLEHRGYILKEPDSHGYSLTLKLFELAHTHSPLQNLLRACERPMRKLSLATGESCHLSILRNGSLFTVYQAESTAKLRLSIEVGATFSAIGSCSGRLLLAALRSDELDSFLAANDEFQQLGEAERERLLMKLEKIRKQGYSYAENESIHGGKDLAVLVGNAEIGLTAALAISSLTPIKQESDITRLLEPLRICSREITSALGLTHIPFPSESSF